MLDSKAITKVQSLILIAIIVVAAVVGGAAYFLWSEEEQSSETIKIGIFADLDGLMGKIIYHAAILAAEQLNSEGGLLGKQVEVIGEDNDLESGADMVVVNSALNRLITVDKVDFIIGLAGGDACLSSQDVIAEHKKIFFNLAAGQLEDTQRVLDNYEKYKYYFRLTENATTSFRGITDCLILMRENIGFNKIGYLAEDRGWTKGITQSLDQYLPENGFDLVYKGTFSLGTVDFSSYFAAAEAAGVEVLVPLIATDMGLSFVKEYYDRQSPLFVYGGLIGIISTPEGWEWTDEKCNHVSTVGAPIVTGYPVTSKILPTRDAYKQRWNEDITSGGAGAYDVVRFILSDAIERAGTIETEAVIEALEETSIETTKARNWVFTESHDVMVGENVHDPEADYQLVMIFQWQNGELVPVYPKKIMEEAGASYTFPDWAGPWDDLD